MKIEEFVKNSLKQDSRNSFEANGDVSETIPEALKSFYMKADPVDVEVNMDGNPVHLFPHSELEDIQEEYHIGDNRFVFASCNGDPIYILDGKTVNTGYVGKGDIKDEKMADDLESFFDLIDK